MSVSLATSPTPSRPPVSRVHRVEVHPAPGEPDPLAHRTLVEAKKVLDGVAEIRTARVYLIETPESPLSKTPPPESSLDDDAIDRIAHELLADPVTQRVVIGTDDPPPGTTTVEIHHLPGVMDPVAQSTREAIAEMLPGLSANDIAVQTGYRYDLIPTPGHQIHPDEARRFAEASLANPVINDIHTKPFHPSSFPHGKDSPPTVVHVPIRDLYSDGLMTLSRDGHLFLNLEEMQAIQGYYQQAGREPTDIELESLAQTWSEHCVHKTLKATIHYQQPPEAPSAPPTNNQGDSGITNSPGPQDWADRPGHDLESDGSLTIHNLLKSTIAAATFKLMESEPCRDWCISVFEDNAGIVRFDDQDAVCIKVETHNHPSAIEPYGGAATGIGGCIRDVMGTGLSARPIANTDVFCVGFPGDRQDELPTGVIPPRRILHRVVAGVRDYGNRMGIPTVNGAVWFHDDYIGNPLVFAGCVGIMPLDRCFGSPKPGDRIIALGGRTGRDGIHGATFSSAELTDTHADPILARRADRQRPSRKSKRLM